MTNISDQILDDLLTDLKARVFTLEGTLNAVIDDMNRYKQAVQEALQTQELRVQQQFKETYEKMSRIHAKK
jgi:hypothetical protein